MTLSIDRIKRYARGFIQSSCFIPFIYLLLAILSYGLLINRLGFFWDDFPYLYLNHSQGITGYPAYMSGDRPFSAWFFMLEGSVFGENPLGYHVFALLIRWAGACVFFQLLEKIFTGNKNSNFLAAAIFLIYPGFLQQPIALIYSLHFAVLFLFLLSILFMLYSLEKSTYYVLFTFLGLTTSLCIFSSEYFAFLELIRPAIIWIFIKKINFSSRISIKKIFLIWSPYFVVFLLFFIWRIFIFKFPTYSPEMISALGQDMISGIAHLLTRVIKDFFIVSLQVWLLIFTPITSFHSNQPQILTWLLISIFSCLILYYAIIIVFRKNREHSHPKEKTMLAGGLLLILLAGIPIWVTDLPINFEFAWNRLTLPFSLGVGLLITGLFSIILKNSKTRRIVFCLLIGFSAGFHYLNANSFTNDWELFKQFFQQFAWRVPSLTQDTTILTDQFPLKYFSDNSLTAPLNWIYDENSHSLKLNFMFYFLDVRLGRRLLELERDLPIDQPYRSFSFHGSTNQLLVLEYHPPACVHIIDNSSFINMNKYPVKFQKAINLSDPNLIQTEIGYKLPDFIKIEVEKDWCYFFEKADLARQHSNWKEITSLADEAFNQNFKPFDPGEYFPFIEAFGQEKDFISAIKLSRSILLSSTELKPQLCTLWKSLLKSMPFEEKDELVSQFYYSELQCLF